MLVIRYRRAGKKNKPTYRIVVAEHTMPLDGRFVADLGAYNPHTKATTLDKPAAQDWLDKGAKPSNSVAKLLQKEKVKHSSVVVIKKKRSPKKAAETAVKEAPKSDAPTAVTAETTAAPTETEATQPAAESVADSAAQSGDAPTEGA